MGKIPAFVVAKLLRFLTRLRGGGSAFPGFVLLRLRPAVLPDSLGNLANGTVFVSGSNGKSTTTTMVVSLLRAHGKRVFSNPAGGNLPQGLASAVVANASLTGRISADVAVLEVDEAYGGIIADAITPDWVVLTNLQVDQLNRFGEPEHVYALLHDLAQRAIRGVLVNAGDPNLRAMGAQLQAAGHQVFWVEVSPEAASSAPHGLVPAEVFPELLEHLTGDPVATLVSVEGSTATLAMGGERVDVTLPGPGLHYAVDATLAAGMARVLLGSELSSPTLAEAMTNSQPVFGRGEKITYRGTEVSLIMMKNLPSLQVNIDALTTRPDVTWVAVDEGTPDPSWIYDVDLGVIDHIDVVTGTKAWQWVLLCEHRGIPYGEVIEQTAEALDRVVALASAKGSHVTAVVNYEQMMLIRRLAGYKELEGTS